MSQATTVGQAPASAPGTGFFERYLTLWVSLCIIAGTLLGHVLPETFETIGHMEVAQVNLPVAGLS